MMQSLTITISFIKKRREISIVAWDGVGDINAIDAQSVGVSLSHSSNPSRTSPSIMTLFNGKIMTTQALNEDLAVKVLRTVDAGLVQGLGKAEPGMMCIEAAVCYAMGLPHSDNPTCVGSAVRTFKIRLNDASWSSPAARAAGMRKLAVAQLGSDAIDQRKFSNLVVLKTINKLLPVIFRDVAEKLTGERKESLQVFASKMEEAYSLEEGKKVVMAAKNAADAAYAAAVAAADATYATYVAYYYAARAATVDTDKYLLLSAEIGLSALKELNSPGCEYLYLCDSPSSISQAS
jgi:hypothetical protein